MLVKQRPDKVIVQYTSWLLREHTSIRILKQQRIRGKLIQISTNTTLAQWRLAICFKYSTSVTGGTNNRNHTRSMLISVMRHWCWQRVQVTCQRSGLGPQKLVSSVPDLSYNLTRCCMVGQIQTSTLHTGGYAGLAKTGLFQSLGLCFVSHDVSLH